MRPSTPVSERGVEEIRREKSRGPMTWLAACSAQRESTLCIPDEAPISWLALDCFLCLRCGRGRMWRGKSREEQRPCGREQRTVNV